MKKVGIFGSEYQADKQLVIKRLFEKLASLEAEVFVDRDFYLFLTDALNYEPPGRLRFSWTVTFISSLRMH